MDPEFLRILLTVRRHGLPEARIVFKVPFAEDPTVSKLLERVNEIIPLENPQANWGFEDYVVELVQDGRSWECLHFDRVTTLVAECDEVIIRPILFEERKKRRFSGREQITSSGRHIFDGTPFGLPRLRKSTDRPAVEIPPLKRRRLLAEDDGDDDQGEQSAEDDDEEEYADDDGEEVDTDSDQEEQPRLLTEYGESEDDPLTVRVSADFQDADADENLGEDEDEDDEFDGDFDMGEDGGEAPELDDSDIQQELRALAEEAAEHSDQPDPSEDAGSDADDDSVDLEGDNKITALRATFPDASADVCKEMLGRYDNNEQKAYRKLRKTYTPQMGLDAMLAFTQPLLGPADEDDGAEEDEDEMAGEHSDVESVVSLTKHYDTNGFPAGSIDNGSAALHVAEARRRAGELIDLPVHKRFGKEAQSASRSEGLSDKEDTSSDSESETSSDSSSDSSDAESESDDEDNQPTKLHEADNPDSNDDSSSNSTSDDSDSESDSEDSGPEVSSSKLNTDAGAKVAPAVKKDANLTSRNKSDSSDEEDSSSTDSSDEESSSESESESDSEEEKRASKPKDGTTKSPELSNVSTGPKTLTQSAADNSQGSVISSNSVANHTAGPTVPPGQGLSKTQKRNARRRAADRLKKMSVSESDASSLAGAVFEESQLAPRPTEEETLEAKKRALLGSLATPPSQKTKQPEIAVSRTDPDAKVVSEAPAETSTSPTQRRARLDVGAGRRMLFGALGLRNPKTKEDEDKIRAGVMKGIKPLANARLLDTTSAKTSLPANPDGTGQKGSSVEDDPDAWKKHITYRGVECCQEGIELSEPPFPFVQRWDPQQQGWQTKKNDRGGSAKRKQRNQAEYYEDSPSMPKAKKQRFADDVTSFGAADNGVVSLNYDDEVPDKVMTEYSQFTDFDDLPSLPEDLSSLPELLDGQAMAGMVITWKQWLLSKNTNWQPELSSLTAMVVNASESDAELRVVLAKRDRNLDRSEKTFDDEGNRVYDRFEAPDEEEDDVDDESGAEDGFRTVIFADMIEPRILQQPLAIVPDSQPATALAGDSRKSQQAVTGSTSGESRSNGDKSTTLDHEDIQQTKSQTERDVSDHEESVVPETNHGESLNTASTQPRQLDPTADVSISEDRRHEISLMMAEAGFRTDVAPSIGPHDNDVDLESPSRQLEETSGAAAIAKASLESSLPLPPSQPTSAPRKSPGLSRDADEVEKRAAGTPPVEYPELDVSPSSQSSAGSGRQPDADGLDIDLGNDSFMAGLDDMPEASSSQHITPQRGEKSASKKPRSRSSRAASETSSVDSFPSISAFSSARTSQKTPAHSQTSRNETEKAGKPNHASSKAGGAKDRQYEAAMRRFQDGFADASQEVNPEEKKLSTSQPTKPLPFRRTMLRSSQADTVPIESSSQIQPKTRPHELPASSQFSVPPGSQVVSLLSSSPEPEAEENYADDSIDMTYLPGSSGWIKKEKERRRTVSKI